MNSLAPSLRAEFRKLLTVRTTYIITGLAILFLGFIAFYVQGWRLTGGSLLNPNLLSGDVMSALGITVFGAIVAILLMTHEYRYNTIAYTLSSSRSRSAVLVAKIIVISTYALFLSLLVAVLAPLLSYLGVQANGNVLAAQHFNLGDLAWRSLYYGWAYGMVGLLVAALVRSQVAAIAALFVIPSVVESLLTLLLKKNAVYLPFSALGQVIDKSGALGGGALSPGKAALVFTGYLIVGWAIAWILFLKRDAS